MRHRSLRKKNPATFSVVQLEIAREVAKKIRHILTAKNAFTNSATKGF